MARHPTVIPSCGLLISLLIGLVLAMAGMPASAQVFRCIDASGNAAFLQQPCDTQRMRDRAAPAPTEGSRIAVQNVGFCPAPDLASLQLALGEAFFRRDINALSGLYHWPSVSRGGSKPVLGWLSSLLDRVLIEIQVQYASRHRITAHGITREVGNKEEDATGLRLILGSDPPGPTDNANLKLVRYAGCWWISELPIRAVEP